MVLKCDAAYCQLHNQFHYYPCRRTFSWKCKTFDSEAILLLDFFVRQENFNWIKNPCYNFRSSRFHFRQLKKISKYRNLYFIIFKHTNSEFSLINSASVVKKANKFTIFRKRLWIFLVCLRNGVDVFLFNSSFIPLSNAAIKFDVRWQKNLPNMIFTVIGTPQGPYFGPLLLN